MRTPFLILRYFWKFTQCRREYKDRTTTILSLFRTPYPGTILFMVSFACISLFVVPFNILMSILPTQRVFVLYPTSLGALTQLWGGTAAQCADYNGKVLAFCPSYFFFHHIYHSPCIFFCDCLDLDETIVSHTVGASWHATYRCHKSTDRRQVMEMAGRCLRRVLILVISLIILSAAVLSWD